MSDENVTVERDNWRCTDPILCTYEWRDYTAQRTAFDQVGVFQNGQRLGYRKSLNEALNWIKSE